MTIALECLPGHVDGKRHRVVEGLKAAVVATGLGQFEQPSFGVFDLVLRGHVEGRVIGDIHHVFADGDQRPAERQVVDRAAIILGIDDGHCFGGETREILRDRQVADLVVGLEEGLDGYGVGRLPHADDFARDLENPAMQRLIEVDGLQEVRDAVIGVVIDENSAEQRLLRFQIVRRLAIMLFRLILGQRGELSRCVVHRIRFRL